MSAIQIVCDRNFAVNGCIRPICSHHIVSLVQGQQSDSKIREDSASDHVWSCKIWHESYRDLQFQKSYIISCYQILERPSYIVGSDDMIIGNFKFNQDLVRIAY